MPGTNVKPTEPDIKKLMNLDSYRGHRQSLMKKDKVTEAFHHQKKSNNTKNKPQKKRS
jgi:hypothetical protein